MAVFATSGRLSKTTRSALAAAGLMFVSTTLVHLSDGYIEAHFHFFVMIPIVALYESWVPFMVAVWVVLVHHGVMGSLDPASVYNHPAGEAHPWTWAGIHALAILAACLGAVVNWRAQEQLREAQADLAEQLVHQASHDAGDPAAEPDPVRRTGSTRRCRSRSGASDDQRAGCWTWTASRRSTTCSATASATWSCVEVARRLTAVVRARGHGDPHGRRRVRRPARRRGRRRRPRGPPPGSPRSWPSRSTSAARASTWRSASASPRPGG